MPTFRYTVVFESLRGGGRHKLCRVMLSDDGSYYLTVPYHRSEKVSLVKRRLNYPNPAAMKNVEPVEFAVLEDDEHRLKLSHHPDGLVQFSGHGIVSGLDENGDPRGLGLRSFKLPRPTAGPACGLTILNPAAFKEADRPRDGDLVFREADLFFAPGDTGVSVELYYFAGMWRRFIYPDVDGPVIWLRHPSGAMLKLRVCMSPGEAWTTGFIGIDVWAAPLKFGDAESGFVMASPTQIVGYNDKGELEAEAIYAAYPPLTEDAAANAVPLVFPTRNDPPYREGGPPPSAEPPASPSDSSQVGESESPAGPPDPQKMRAVAALAHAKILRETGDQIGSRLLLEQAVLVGDPELTAVAQYELGNVCRDLGDIEAARRAYESASTANGEIAGLALYNLGYLLQSVDPIGSKAAYSHAISLGHPETGPQAAVNLGIALFQEGSVDSSRAAFESAIKSGHPIQRPKAMVNLAQLLVAAGDITSAASLLEEAIDANIPGVSPQGLLIRGDLHLGAGERSEAFELYKRAFESGDPTFSAWASLRLGSIHQQAGRDDDARRLYERAIEVGPPEVASAARVALEKLT